MCEQLRKKKMDMCYLHEVRWRGQEARFIGIKGRRSKLWWSENNHGTGRVGILGKEELCEKVVEVRRKSDRVMAMMLVFEEEVIRVICAYATRLEDQSARKINFVTTWQVSGIYKTLMKWFLVWGTSTDMLGNGLMVLTVCMVGIKLVKKMLRKEDSSSFVMKNCGKQVRGKHMV